MIDICDFAVGLSRQLYGLTIASRAPGPPHDGDVASARRRSASSRRSTSRSRCGRGTRRSRFVCGNPVVWKPSEKTPLTALARRGSVRARRRATSARRRRALVARAHRRARRRARRWSTIRACRSSRRRARPRMGRAVGAAARARASAAPSSSSAAITRAIVAPSADLDLAVRADRLLGDRHGRPALHHAAPADRARERLRQARAAAEAGLCSACAIGDPRETGTLVGPLIDDAAFDDMQAALASARSDGRHGHRRRARARRTSRRRRSMCARRSSRCRRRPARAATRPSRRSST